MTNGGGAHGVRYYTFAVDDNEDGEGRSANERIRRSDWSTSLSGVRRTGALWWTLGLVVGCSAAITLYSNAANSKYIEIVYNTGAAGGIKDHKLSGEFFFFVFW